MQGQNVVGSKSALLLTPVSFHNLVVSGLSYPLYERALGSEAETPGQDKSQFSCSEGFFYVSEV